MEENLDFSVAMSENKSDDVILMTTAEAETKIEEMLQRSFASYDPSNRMYSAVLNAGTSSPTVTLARLAQLAQSPQSDLQKILECNAIVNQYINSNFALGMVASTISSCINTNYRISYKDNFPGQKKKANMFTKAKDVINTFCNAVDLKNVIRDMILTAWINGNYVGYVRKNGDSNYTIDQYPLGIVELASYFSNGTPMAQINIEQLKSALQKTILKDKSGKALYFKDTLEEIKASFGEEVLKSYKNKDSYCKLNPDYTCVVRTNTFGKLYGLSDMFHALTPAVILENLQNADVSLAKTKAKTILWQSLRKELLEKDSRAKQYEALAYAHTNLMNAFKQQTCIVSTPPSVDKIEYIASKGDENSTAKQELYTRQVLSSLGVNFLSGENDISATVAKLSFEVLLRKINAIGENVERSIENIFRTVLRDAGIDLMIYCPTIKIIDSEMLDADTRNDLAKLLLGTFATSRETAFGMVGIDLHDEKMRREQENSDNLDEVFKPYPISYTTPGSTDSPEAGRPADKKSNDEDKQQLDKELNNT